MDWAGLPAELLIEFAVRLTVIGWLNFRADDTTTATFFSFLDGRCRTAPLPEPAIRSPLWIGSARGWVVTADEECSLHLLNPITGAQLPLPCITTMGGFFQALPRTAGGKATGFLFDESSFLAVHWPERAFYEHARPDEIPIDRMPQRFLRKAVPLRDPASGCGGDGEHLVVMIHGPRYKLAFARRRDARWVTLPSPYLFEDVILHKGQLYAMTACGALLVWEPDGETFRSRVAVPEHDEGEEYVVFRKYLAESLDGDLVLVWREHRSSNGGDGESDDSSTSDDDDGGDYAKPDPTVGFQVFVLREGRQGRREWKELRDLGGAALFIGYNSAVFFPAGEVPGLLPDCIYFTDDTVGIISCRNKQEPRDMGVFTFQHEEQSRA
ncbi:uncharacterized protein LOC120710129 [Panicum virgatum]|uniref:uncharacterized protein LOC120710129 n=1 Tax=Panicum virgatum TaxID=38727 RepID=UPI0019D631E3|nr:uncharacterized protein LOC120710129 [Panicum virgatum]